MCSQFTILKRAILWLMLWLVPVFHVAHAQEYSAEQVKAELVLRFINYIDWPGEGAFDDYRIGIISDNDQLRDALVTAAQNRTIKARPIRLFNINNVAAGNDMHVVLIAGSHVDDLISISRSLRDTQTLLISDNAQNTTNIMLNLRSGAGNTIAFEVNKANILLEQLKIDNDILLLGGNELDVAQLYREMESRFSEVAKEYNLVKLQAEEANRALKNAQDDLAKTQEDMRSEGVKLQQQAEVIAQQTDVITEHQATLAEFEQRFENARSEMADNELRLQAQAELLTQRTAEVSALTNETQTNAETLRKQQADIQAQRKELADLTSELSLQRSSLERSNTWLFGAASVAIVFLLLLLYLMKIMRERKVMAAQLIEINEELETKVAQRTQKLESAMTEAVNANRAKSDFIANMSHEFRTPLNAIIGFSDAILHGIYGKLENAQISDSIKNVQKSGQHLLSIVNKILDLAKVEANEFELQEETVDVAKLLDGIEEMLSGASSRKSLILANHVEIDAQLFVDHLMVKQMVINLVQNAIKFNKENGRIDLTFTKDDEGNAVLSVADTGVGIPEAQLVSVMEPFFQVGTHSMISHEGTGLGLALVNAHMRLHGGSVSIESQVGEGTTVSLVFPKSRIR